MSELNFEKQLKRMERDGVITRAQFLQLMAVAGAFVMLGTDKAYAAKSDARGRIVIIGGGADSPLLPEVSTAPTMSGNRRMSACPTMSSGSRTR